MPGSVSPILSAIDANNSKLRALRISVSDEDASHIATFIQKNKTVTNLTLDIGLADGTLIEEGLDPELIYMIAQAIQHNITLTSLTIHYYELPQIVTKELDANKMIPYVQKVVAGERLTTKEMKSLSEVDPGIMCKAYEKAFPERITINDRKIDSDGFIKHIQDMRNEQFLHSSGVAKKVKIAGQPLPQDVTSLVASFLVPSDIKPSATPSKGASKGPEGHKR